MWKLKAYADDILNAAQVIEFALYSDEDIVGQGENAGFQHFLPSL